jgi:hypothetical protein
MQRVMVYCVKQILTILVSCPFFLSKCLILNTFDMRALGGTPTRNSTPEHNPDFNKCFQTEFNIITLLFMD